MIRNVRIFNGEHVIPETEVLIEDGLIAAIGNPGDLSTAATVIDGAGQTLLPGLIDSHTHRPVPVLMRQAAVFGVTTQLDMFTFPERVAAAKDYLRTEAGGQAADLFSATILVAAGGNTPTITVPEDAQSFVDQRIAEGADYIKIYYDDGSTLGRQFTKLSRATLAASIAAAHRRDKLAVVHITAQDAAREAVAAGADGLVHVFVDRHPDTDLAAFVAEHDAFLIPTLTYFEDMYGEGDSRARIVEGSFDGYVTLLGRWFLEAVAPHNPNSTLSYQVAEAAVLALHETGVPILAGTDSPNPGTTHGASMHRELELLVRAGLTPTDALAAGTSVPADAFELSDRGRIAPGLRADILLVNGDPTTDITTTRNIGGVWRAGVQVDRGRYRAQVVERQAAFSEAAEAGDVAEAIEIYDAYPQGHDGEALVDESVLNTLGYLLLSGEQVDAAIAIFQLAVREYPASWNAYDSLGEGHMVREDTDLAIEHYERSLELNPDNDNAEQWLAKLRSGQ